MTAPFTGSTRFDRRRHDPSRFDSGNEAMDRWLVRSAGQSDRRGAARTFVATDAHERVIAYYSLLAAELRHHDATDRVRHGMSRQYPIPVALLARLAVDRSHQGRGTGAVTLRDALSRVTVAAEHVAMRAVVVHAIDDSATRFYERHGFRALSATPRTLMVTLAELQAAGYP